MAVSELRQIDRLVLIATCTLPPFLPPKLVSSGSVQATMTPPHCPLHALLCLFLAAVLVLSPSCAAGIRPFSLADVQLDNATDFAQGAELSHEYLLLLDPDNLLFNFRSGMPRSAPSPCNHVHKPFNAIACTYAQRQPFAKGSTSAKARRDHIRQTLDIWLRSGPPLACPPPASHTAGGRAPLSKFVANLLGTISPPWHLPTRTPVHQVNSAKCSSLAVLARGGAYKICSTATPSAPRWRSRRGPTSAFRDIRRRPGTP